MTNHVYVLIKTQYTVCTVCLEMCRPRRQRIGFGGAINTSCLTTIEQLSSPVTMWM